MSFLLSMFISFAVGSMFSAYRASIPARKALREAKASRDFLLEHPGHFLRDWFDEHEMESIVALRARAVREHNINILKAPFLLFILAYYLCLDLCEYLLTLKHKHSPLKFDPRSLED